MARFQLPEEVRERQARTREAAQQAMVGGLRPYIAAEMTAARLRLRDREMDYLVAIQEVDRQRAEIAAFGEDAHRREMKEAAIAHKEGARTNVRAAKQYMLLLAHRFRVMTGNDYLRAGVYGHGTPKVAHRAYPMFRQDYMH